MLRKLIIVGAALVLAGSSGLFFGSVSGLLGGPVQALAAGGGPQGNGNGVGPSPTGATGQARACEAHAANIGNSNGNGFSCTSVESFSVSIIGPTAGVPNNCDLQFTGIGLSPGAFVYVALDGDIIDPPFKVFDNLALSNYMTVPANGVLNDVGPLFTSGDTFDFTVQGASGDTVSYGPLFVTC